jgi:hypothetical protein
MSDLTHSSQRDDPEIAAINSVQEESLDGRLFGLYFGRVTKNKDPEKHNRIKVQLHWQEEEGQPFETGWITQLAPFAGPTNMKRGRVFGMDWPVPEVGSLVVVGFVGGNIHDAIYLGQPRYLEDSTGAPRVEKDRHIDWSMRCALQNGFEFGVDTEGNTYMYVPGNLRVKIQCGGHISSRGPLTFISSKLRWVALSVLRIMGVTIDQTNYPRPDEAPELRDMMIDTFKGPPGRKDPQIGKISDLE